MTPLAKHLAALIEQEGPISIADYMAACLGHPAHGYYATRDPLGAAGDFVTAPEVSQMFGELIGLWCADIWQRCGSPAQIRLVELGPGRGTLMRDALHAAGVAPGFLDAARIHLVETSPVLRAAQAANVAAAEWHDSLHDVPDGPMILIANEFFDALPIRQFVRTEQGWHERRVAVDADTGCPRFQPVLSPDPVAPADGLPPAFRDAPVGSIAETSPASVAHMSEIARRVAADGIAALVIDYGHTQSAPGDTLQAVRGHTFADPFAAPGEADLTAHVDLAALADAGEAAGARVLGPVTQAAFLTSLGIGARAERLKATATDSQARDIDSALARLTGRDQMGSLFKAVAVARADGPAPAGFEGG